jgi:hypothetical protein
MKRYHDVLLHLFELRRLMHKTGMSLSDALSLLVDQLQQFDEAEQREEDLKHAEYPRHVYGY